MKELRELVFGGRVLQSYNMHKVNKTKAYPEKEKEHRASVEERKRKKTE